MRIAATSSGGRVVTASNGLAVLTIEFDRRASGRQLRIVTDDGQQVGTAQITIVDRSAVAPPPVSPEQRQLLAKRMEACAACPDFGSATSVRHYRITTVRCLRCGCGGLRLADSDCPAGKWPPPAKITDAQA